MICLQTKINNNLNNKIAKNKMEKSESYTDIFNRLNNQLDGVETPLSLPNNSPISNVDNPSFNSDKPNLTNLTFNVTYLYGGVPIVVLILFILTQPKFLKDETINENGEKSYTINIKKIIIWTLVISTLINVGIFVYFYRQKNKH